MGEERESKWEKRERVIGPRWFKYSPANRWLYGKMNFHFLNNHKNSLSVSQKLLMGFENSKKNHGC
jgi:hypothetical protein